MEAQSYYQPSPVCHWVFEQPVQTSSLKYLTGHEPVFLRPQKGADMASTLLLDQEAWDMVLDAAGNIALAGNPYSIAQDASSAVRTFIGECWYDTSLGLPYFESVLGQLPPPSFLRQRIIDAAMTVPGVSTAKVVFASFDDRGLTGQIQITDTDGNTSEANF